MRSMRLSQTVSPFGVGAILDILGESLIACDISTWPFDQTRRLSSERVEQALGVSELRSAPSVPSRASDRTPGIWYSRFPRWTFCQVCRRMTYLTRAVETGEPPRCGHCKGGLVPMRFIVVGTTRGHAMDVPWDKWAHSEHTSEGQSRCRNAALTFTSRSGATEGLASLVVGCDTCQASRHLGDLTADGAMARIGFRCRGRQPWQTVGPDCDERLAVLQRGATNVTISETTTAIDIPEPSVARRDIAQEIRAHRNWENLRTAPTGPRAAVLIELIAEDLEIDEELVRQTLAAPATADPFADAREGLLADEWDAFVQAIESDEPTGTPDFVVNSTNFLCDMPSSTEQVLAASVGSVVLVHRLRELRVLHGFRRYEPGSALIDVNLEPRGRARWLPAIESFGEGIFLTLREDALRVWERDEEVVRQAARIERRRRGSPIGSRFPVATPRLILLHTTAHLLIRRLAFTSGYSSASLRERVYSGEGPSSKAGLLIYTAAGDAEGTLGGLVRQGHPNRLALSLIGALEDAGWCSNDPVCVESKGQGLGSMNLAACHACSLVAETSCERANVLLDRALVVGGDTVPGFFSDVLDSVRTETR